MSAYNHSVVFIVPIANVETARKVSRSLDPDIGGYEAFQSLASATGLEPATHAVYSTPCRESFLQTLNALTASAEVLKAAVDADYAVRWPGEIAPTLIECDDFLTSLQIHIDMTFDDAVSQAGLSMIELNE